MKHPAFPFFVAAIAGLFGGPAMALNANESRAPQTLTTPEFDPAKVYADVVVIHFETLAPPTKKEVEAIINDTAAGELKLMQSLIGGSRQAILTLAAVGMDPSQVIAAGVTPEGVLTLIVQQTA